MTIILDNEKTREEEIAKVKGRIASNWASNLYISDAGLMYTIISYKTPLEYARLYNDYMSDKMSSTEYHNGLNKLYLRALKYISDKEYLCCIQLTKAYFKN